MMSLFLAMLGRESRSTDGVRAIKIKWIEEELTEEELTEEESFFEKKIEEELSEEELSEEELSEEELIEEEFFFGKKNEEECCFFVFGLQQNDVVILGDARMRESFNWRRACRRYFSTYV